MNNNNTTLFGLNQSFNEETHYFIKQVKDSEQIYRNQKIASYIEKPISFKNYSIQRHIFENFDYYEFKQPYVIRLSKFMELINENLNQNSKNCNLSDFIYKICYYITFQYLNLSSEFLLIHGDINENNILIINSQPHIYPMLKLKFINLKFINFGIFENNSYEVAEQSYQNDIKNLKQLLIKYLSIISDTDKIEKIQNSKNQFDLYYIFTYQEFSKKCQQFIPQIWWDNEQVTNLNVIFTTKIKSTQITQECSKILSLLGSLIINDLMFNGQFNQEIYIKKTQQVQEVINLVINCFANIKQIQDDIKQNNINKINDIYKIDQKDAFLDFNYNPFLNCYNKLLIPLCEQFWESDPIKFNADQLKIKIEEIFQQEKISLISNIQQHYLEFVTLKLLEHYEDYI